MGAPKSTSSGWRRRPLLSASLRVAATLVPVAISVGVAFTLNGLLPHASDTLIIIFRSLGLAVCSLAALVATDALLRRFLPLAALLQLSLVFPDQTPSRFKAALKSGSGRRLAREVALARRDGISDDPSRAAEQLLMLATAMGDHDRRTRGHSERVRLYADLIAEELQMSPEERSKLQWAALIHDIGKIEVPTEILNKKGRPDAKEWAILQNHPLAGERLAAPVEPWLGDAVHAVGGHHERWDGAGYPRGLQGDAIPRAAAVVAVADAFEVMTAVRSYKQAMPLTEARAELTRCAGTHFSPEVVRALLNVSIGRLRRSMGVLAALAHVPFVGQATKAAAYAPDTVSTAVGFTTSTATAGAGVLVAAGALAVASPTPPVGADAATIVSPRAGHETHVLIDAASTLPAAPFVHIPAVAVAEAELLAATPAPSNFDVSTIAPSDQSIAGATSGGPAATSDQRSVTDHDSHRKNAAAADDKDDKPANAAAKAKDDKQDAKDEAKPAKDEAKDSRDAGNAAHDDHANEPAVAAPPVAAEAPDVAAPPVAAEPPVEAPPVEAPKVKDESNDKNAARNSGGNGGGDAGKPNG